jgi:hypothetical protein
MLEAHQLMENIITTSSVPWAISVKTQLILEWKLA